MSCGSSRGISPLFRMALHNCAESSSSGGGGGGGGGSRGDDSTSPSPRMNEASHHYPHPVESPRVIEVPQCTLPNGSSLQVKVVYYNPQGSCTSGSGSRRRATDSEYSPSPSSCPSPPPGGNDLTHPRSVPATVFRRQKSHHHHSHHRERRPQERRFSTGELRQWLQSEEHRHLNLLHHHHGHIPPVRSKVIVSTTATATKSSLPQTPKPKAAAAPAPPALAKRKQQQAVFQSELATTCLVTSASASSLSAASASSGSLDSVEFADVLQEVSTDSLGYQTSWVPSFFSPFCHPILGCSLGGSLLTGEP